MTIIILFSFQEKYRGLFEGLSTLFMGTLLMVAVRLQLMGSKAPEFAPADNPSADCPSRLTRTLTFLYLPAFNLWLLVQPTVLSFDWSMEAIPLIQSVTDIRNLATAIFYLTLAYLGWNALFRRRECDDNSGDLRSASASPVPGSTSSVLNSNLISSSLLGDSSSSLVRGSNGYVPSVSDAVLGVHCYSSAVGCGNYGSGNGSTSGSLSSSSSLRSERTRWSSNSSVDVDGNSAGRNSGVDLTVISLSMLVFPFIPATNSIHGLLPFGGSGFSFNRRLPPSKTITIETTTAERTTQLEAITSQKISTIPVPLGIFHSTRCLFSEDDPKKSRLEFRGNSLSFRNQCESSKRFVVFYIFFYQIYPGISDSTSDIYFFLLLID